MRRAVYILATFVLGGLVHLVFNRFLNIGGAGPEVLLLLVVAHGFFVGSVTAETLGFLWGLSLDATGVGFFGMNSLLFSVAGFVSGALRRRVASERPAAQLAIGFISTLYYLIGSYLIRLMIGGAAYKLSLGSFLGTTVINVILVVVVFVLLEIWLSMWNLQSEEN